jgi:hypothetical protein
MYSTQAAICVGRKVYNHNSGVYLPAWESMALFFEKMNRREK